MKTVALLKSPENSFHLLRLTLKLKEVPDDQAPLLRRVSRCIHWIHLNAEPLCGPFVGGKLEDEHAGDTRGLSLPLLAFSKNSFRDSASFSPTFSNPRDVVKLHAY